MNDSQLVRCAASVERFPLSSRPMVEKRFSTGTDEALRVKQLFAASSRLGNSPLFQNNSAILLISWNVLKILVVILRAESRTTVSLAIARAPWMSAVLVKHRKR